jgi:hypothetical protein
MKNMHNKKQALKIISEKLKDIPWAIFSGTAIEIYTEGKRLGKDIDIIVPGDKLNEVAKRFNTKAILETRESGRVKFINDYHIQIEIAGIPVEFVGRTDKIIIDGKEYDSTSKEDLRKLFNKVKKKMYLGIEVFVVPIEEILVQKMIFNRTGKWQDKEDIKLLLKIHKIDKKSLVNAFNRWGVFGHEQEIFMQKLENSLDRKRN